VSSLDALRADLPASLVVRTPTDADTDGVVDLVQRCDVDAVGEPDSGRDEIVGMLGSPDLDPEATVVALDGDQVVLFVWIERSEPARETWVDAYADPAGSTAELTRAGLAHGLRAAAGHREVAGGGEWTARTGCFATDAVLVAEVERAGFARVRRFWRMRIDLTTVELPPDEPLPPDVTVRAVRDEAGRRALHGIVQESFQDHWNHNDRDYDAWMRSLAAMGSDDPDGWWLLEVDGEPAAACLLDDSRADLGDGYVRTLGVLREFRGRGLGQLLLHRAFRYYRDQDRAGVLLAVDSTSPTGANHLYEKVGMRPVRVIDAWSLPLHDAR
jgi:ribosomal protein S18 acetylase RimI-like enzyme